MGRRVGRPQAGHEPLSRERILETALHLVDTEGIDALTMRRLAAALEVDPMAIYHHVPGKGAVVDGLVETVFAGLRVPPSAATWQGGVRAFANAYRAVARAHPHLILHLVADTTAGGEAVLAANEALYTALTTAGLPPIQIVRAAEVVVDYLNGFALAESTGRVGQPGEAGRRKGVLDGYPAERFPMARRVYNSLAEDELHGGFEAELEIILAGIAALAGTSH